MNRDEESKGWRPKMTIDASKDEWEKSYVLYRNLEYVQSRPIAAAGHLPENNIPKCNSNSSSNLR